MEKTNCSYLCLVVVHGPFDFVVVRFLSGFCGQAGHFSLVVDSCSTGPEATAVIARRVVIVHVEV